MSYLLSQSSRESVDVDFDFDVAVEVLRTCDNRRKLWNPVASGSGSERDESSVFSLKCQYFFWPQTKKKQISSRLTFIILSRSSLLQNCWS